jgi:hypothetical protein
MKQKLLYLFIIFAVAMGGLFQTERVEAQTTKVYWDGILMVPGQAGKIKVVKPINLWKRTSDGLVFQRILKPGEQYRVYRYDNLYGGQYGLGGGMYITKMAGYVEYKTPSKAKLKELANAQGTSPAPGNTASNLFPVEKTPSLTIGKVSSQSVTQIAPGVRKKFFDIDSSNGSQKLFMLEYDGVTSNIELKTELAKDQIKGFETTSSQANSVVQNDSYHVVGGVNGDYFDKYGQPIDLMMMDGSIVSTPQTALSDLAVLGIKSNGKAIIGAPKVAMNVTVNGGQSYAINSVNRSRAANHLVIYTKDFSATTGTNELGTEIRVKVESGKLNGSEKLVGTVTENVTNVGNAKLNSGEIILSGHHFASQFLEKVQVGDKIEITTAFTPAEWNDVRESVSGRYHLVKNGALQTIKVAGVAPRTAVGIKKDGSIFTIVVDGRSTASKGLTLQNTAKLMKDLGAQYAMTFDGGGSSTLVARELGANKVSVANKPSDGGERSVSNTLLFISKYKTSALATIAPASDVLNLFQGATYTNLSVPVKGIDQYMNPVAVSGNGTVTSSIIKSSNGKQTVTAGPGTYAGVVTYDGKTTNINIKVTNTLDSIKTSVNSLQVAKAKTAQLTASGMNNGQAVITAPTAFKWTTTIGTISNGKFTAPNKDGIGTITVTYGSKSATIPVVVGDVAPTILESFNKGISNYEASGDRVKTVSVQSVTNDRDGSKALKLAYDFTGTTGTSGAYVDAKTSLTISTPAKKIGMWVKGDGKGHWLRSQITDASGKTVQLDFSKNVNWTDWQFVSTEVPAGLTYPLKMALPVRYMETENANKTNGEIIIDDIQSIYKD